MGHMKHLAEQEEIDGVQVLYAVPDEAMKFVRMYNEDLTLLLQLFASELGPNERQNLRNRLTELRKFLRDKDQFYV